MRKRVCAILLVIACVLGLAACGSSDDTTDTTIALTQDQEQQWYDAAEAALESIDTAVRDGSSSALEEDAVYGPACDSWENALPDIGEVQSMEGESVTFTTDDGTVILLVRGSKHDAEVVFTLEGGRDSDGNRTYTATGITTNVSYNMTEKMQQAGLNTLLGMGLTFVVLILLALIIAAFGRILTKFNDSRRIVKTTEAPPAPAAAVPVTAPTEELSDDTELVAVIAAAIAAYEGRQTTDGFVVRSIRKSRRK